MNRLNIAVAVNLAFLLGSTLTQADEPQVKAWGQCVDYGYSSFGYDFRVQAVRPDLPEGTQIELAAGFGGHGSVSSEPYREEFHWDREHINLMVRDIDGSFRADTRLFYMQTGGYFSHLEFVLKISLPDGQTSVEPSNGSYYSAVFFNPKGFGCEKLIRMTPLTLQIDAPR